MNSEKTPHSSSCKGELWGVFSELLGEKIPCDINIESALQYIYVHTSLLLRI